MCIRDRLQVDRSRPANVVADEQIEVAVAVVVEPGGARAPLVGAAADARYGGDVAEVTADVPEQVVDADGRDEQVGPAVVVVVRRRDAHAVDVRGQPGGRGDVREAPFAEVAIQHEPRPGRAAAGWRGRGPR